MQANPFTATVGKRVKECRIAAGLTQEQVADKLGIIRQTYTTIENGTRPLKDEEIVILAEVFNTTADFLLRGKETKNLDICSITGLSNESASFLRLANKNENQYYQIITDCLNILLSTEPGNRILYDLGTYLKCDYSTAYSYKSTDGKTFEPLKTDIGFKIHGESYPYRFYKPEILEQTAELLLIKQISELKSELQQEKPEQKKRVRKVKK